MGISSGSNGSAIQVTQSVDRLSGSATASVQLRYYSGAMTVCIIASVLHYRTASVRPCSPSTGTVVRCTIQQELADSTVSFRDPGGWAGHHAIAVGVILMLRFRMLTFRMLMLILSQEFTNSKLLFLRHTTTAGIVPNRIERHNPRLYTMSWILTRSVA